MPTARDRSFDSGGLRLHYLEWGDPGSPAVILLHGTAAHAHWWDFFAPALADAFHVAALDLRGHGKSGHADPADYSLETYAADVAALARDLKVGSVHVVGHSLGALVAIVLAADPAVQVGSLVLVDIRVHARRARERPFLDRLRSFPHPAYESTEEAIRRFRLLPTRTAAAPPVLAHVAAAGVRLRDDGRVEPRFDRATLNDRIPRDVSAELALLRCPLLYVRGAKSPIAPPVAAAEIRALVPHAEIAEVAGAYHHVMLDDPAGFEAAVSPFLRRENHR